MSRAVVALIAALPATGCKSRADETAERAVAPVRDAASARALRPVPADWWKGAGCPDGSELRGAAPPRGTAIWCETAPGRKHGPETRWHEPGSDGSFVVASTGTYRDGDRDGLWVTRGADGLLDSERGYRDGVLHGPHRIYDQRGALSLEGHYADGLPHGTFVAYRGARELGRFTMERGTGTMRRWHPGGELAQEYGMVGGVPHGTWTNYDADGNKIEETDYVRGARSGRYRRWAGGALVEEGRYADDMKEGRWIQRDASGAVIAEESYRRGVAQP